jgi:hypothetical protein
MVQSETWTLGMGEGGREQWRGRLLRKGSKIIPKEVNYNNSILFVSPCQHSYWRVTSIASGISSRVVR